MRVVEQGDRVRVHYTGRLEDGTVFDSSQGGEPLEFIAGGSEVIPGVSNAVLGMSVGETKTVTVPPEDAYGPHQEGLVQRVAIDRLPPGVQVGMPLKAVAGDREVILWVTELGEEEAVLDANHPLAGKTLIFDVVIKSVRRATPEEIQGLTAPACNPSDPSDCGGCRCG